MQLDYTAGREGVSKSLNEASELRGNRSDERVGAECVSAGRLDDISESTGGFLGKAVRGVLGMWRMKTGMIPRYVINGEDDTKESPTDKKGAQVKANKTQNYVLFACGAVIVLTLLFPPFHHGNWNDGYGFLFDPPKRGMVNTGMLLTQSLCVAIIGGILLFVFLYKE